MLRATNDQPPSARGGRASRVIDEYLLRLSTFAHGLSQEWIVDGPMDKNTAKRLQQGLKNRIAATSGIDLSGTNYISFRTGADGTYLWIASWIVQEYSKEDKDNG